jgi:plastocyanin
MLWRYVRTGALLLTGSVLVLVTASACGGAGTTASAAREAPPAKGESTDAAAVTTILALDNKWDRPELVATAGSQVKLTLENKGQAIHNWRVAGVKGQDGKDIGTQLLAGGKSETITFVIARPGAYEFICDVHPVEMKGKITVQ